MKALSVRRKIQLGVLGIILVVVGASFLAMGAVLKVDADPSAPLRSYAGELDYYRRTEGAALYAAVAVASDDSAVETAVHKNDVASLRKEFERLSQDIHGAIALDVALVTNGQGEPLVHAYLPQPSLGSIKDLRSFHDAIVDVSVKDAVEFLGGDAFQVSAEPYYLPGSDRGSKNTTGVLLVGRKLSAILTEFSLEHPNSGMNVAIVRDGRIVASDLANGDRGTFEATLANRTAGIGTATISGSAYDLFIRDIDACGGRCARVAQIAVFRSRVPIDAERRKRLLEAALYLLLTTFVALGGGWLLARWITKPIEGYVEATAALAKGGGDLTRRLEFATDDELGKLAQNLNAVFGQIQDLALHVTERATEVGTASEEIRSASRALLEGAAEQATRLASTGAATTEMSASIQQVAMSATEANEVARRSGRAIEDAVVRMAQIRDAVERAADRMALLGDTNKRIGSIVDTIHTIADQTSLLALNAAIEAAHAGEHGRGFTVVADAVGQLAMRVDRSAKEIDELIGQSRAQTEEALESMAAGRREVEKGSALINDSIEGIRRVLTVFSDTTAAVKEQAIASDEIARNMEAVGRIAEDVLVTTKQAVAQGDRLTHIATALEEAVAGFKLEPDISSRRLAKEPKLLRS